MGLVNQESDIPYLSTGQMREVDRAMIEDYGVLLIQMMENAGRELAHLARSRFLEGDPRRRKVLVLAGTGGNGGGGLVCARRLDNWGAEVSVWLSASPSQLAETPRHQLTILEHMEVPIEIAGDEPDLPSADLIVDALIGYSLSGAPRGPSAGLIRAANAHTAPVLALDVPSGVDTATGAVYDPAIMAEATLTLALPKQGLQHDAAKKQVGELYLADISIPLGLYSHPPLGLDVGPLFARDDILRVW
ncbi:MAG: NAD(P)H-hydrate epimerase [Chloroflexi bacterium]|nr:NAD(P)H-hydrate epimerase [Chloroflexota bacterium]